MERRESNMPETSMPDLAEEVVVEDNKDETDAAIVYDSWDMLNSMWKALVSDKSLDGEVMWRCIQFCYLFPKTHEFNKDDIIQLWIAEGFIPVTHIRLETTAGLYFEALQELSIFLFSFLASTGEPRYKLNPSIVDLLEEGHSADEYYRVDGGGYSCISENTLHFSFRYSIDPVTLKDLFQAKNLCSLLILHQHRSHIEQVPRDLFLNLRSLRVLDFSHTGITELPSTIRYLKDLRYLNLSGTPIQVLPNSLGSLSQMQTLKLKDCFKLVSLPKCVRKLINLRHLEVDVAYLLVSMPPGLGDLTELQTLPAFVVGKEDGCHITELKHMVNVHGTLHILRLENVFSLEEAKEAALDQLKYIQKLELQWTELHDGHEILESLRPHMELEELQIVGYGDAKFPTWIGDPIFSKLTTITIHDCRKCELLSPLGKLPLLKALSISKMLEVKIINHQFCGRDMDNESLDLERLDLETVSENLSSDSAFTRLVSLTLNEIPKLEKWTGVVVGDFPQLQRLNIFGCSKLITLPQLSLLNSLIKLEIRLCPALESLPKKGLPNSLQHLVIMDCPLLKEFYQKEEEQWRKLVHIPNVWIDYLQISGLIHSEFLQNENGKKSVSVSAQWLGNEPAKPSETESAQLSEIESVQTLEIEPAQPSETESSKLSEVVLVQRLETEPAPPSKTKSNQLSEIESAQSSHDMGQLSTKERSWLPQWHRLYKFLKRAQSEWRFARMRKARTSVSTGVKKMAIPCWKPAVEDEEDNLKSRHDIGRVDELLCHKDLGHDNKVEPSMTVTRANNLLEDQSPVESGSLYSEFSVSTSAQRFETEPAKPSETESMDSVPSAELNSASENIPDRLDSPLRVPPMPSRFSMSPQMKRIGSVHLNMSQVMKATENFSPLLQIGEGGFGTVYRAQLQDGQVVAIKRAKKEHICALQSEFRSEVELLAKIEHRNLVKLLGYVDKGNERILITEHVPNGTLREHLDGQHGRILDFNQRLEISIDVTHALTYLHLYAEKQIIHRDVKSSNILLTETFRAKVADFGFAKVGPTGPDETHVVTKVKGTAGYLDPEYLRTYQLTPKSDVYSFGILIIEILTGRRPVELRRDANERVTVRWAFQRYNEGNVVELLDPLINEVIDAGILSKMFSLAFQCAAPTRADRPNMKQVGEQLWGIRMDYLKSVRRG